MFDYAAYARDLRHELHQCPEIGFDLTHTLAIVRRELEAMGVSYTEQYGKSSIVAVINEGKAFTIGLRGDMDALPVTEAGSNPFPSRHEGRMHACGHDAHTAQMLAVARALKDREAELRCRVKILFTPAEEYIEPGCNIMADNGVMDDVAMIAACHVDPTVEVGRIAVREGGCNANSLGLLCEFFGKSAHAQFQERGVDAIRMAVEAYMGMELMRAREVSAKETCILNVGAINGGVTNNIVCDYAKLFLTVRTYTDELNRFFKRRIEEICEGAAALCGGKAKVTQTKLLPYVYNHPEVTALLRQAAESVVGQEKIGEAPRAMGAEDFSFLSRKKPGVLFRLGTANDTNPDTRCSLHNDHFDIDERCFEYGIPIFLNFVLNNQDGISITKEIEV